MRRLSKAIHNLKNTFAVTLFDAFGKAPAVYAQSCNGSTLPYALATQETSELSSPPPGKFVDFSKGSECGAVTLTGDTDATKLAGNTAIKLVADV
jgi:hypothetical protein